MNSIEELVERKLIEYQKSYKFELPSRNFSVNEVISAIEHTLLRPTATEEEIDKLCDEAIQYGFCGVCVNPVYVKRAIHRLKNSNVKVVSVVGFPLGANTQYCKARETEELVELGVDEIDMVINLPKLKSRDYKYVYEDIKSVVESSRGKPVKVIIETCYLNLEEKIAACVIAELAGAKFVKTSTGFGSSGATVEDVHLMKWCAPRLNVKASGGIRSYQQAVQMLLAGASRIGTSSSVQIVKEGVSR
ncbi:deoxyribose-phosphate aldolase [Pseudothermotoga sp.]|uniref:deoxyribose-phosphate aldolase n=1 Tax=Pseudothermotoga sp. TaxID=2033661 RepID=UPI0031F62840